MTSNGDHDLDLGIDDKGKGEPVILLHSSSSSRRQWRRLIEAIGNQYRVLAIDLLGYGDTGLPDTKEGFHLEQEVALVERLMDRIEGPVHLVGHSYGGVVGMKTVLKHRDRIRSLYVHEPVAFSLLRMEGLLKEWNEIQWVSRSLGALVERGCDEHAAELFLDYWGGKGTWSWTPDQRKPYLVRTMPKVVLDFTAVFGLDDPLLAYADLSVPTLVTTGTTGPMPARRVAEVLARVLGEANVLQMEGVGHMAPVTHPDEVNFHIVRHLNAHRIL